LGPKLDAYLIGQPPFLILEPGASGNLIFDVQNTGLIAWTPSLGVNLALVDGDPLGAEDPQTLAQPVPVGRMARWSLPVQAPRTPGIYRTAWQMTRDDVSFGPVLSGAVIVVPHAEGLGIDYGALISAWIQDLGEQFAMGLVRFWRDMAARVETWSGDGVAQAGSELDRLWRALAKWVQEIDPGGPREGE
jgi:hypothetical protein